MTSEEDGQKSDDKDERVVLGPGIKGKGKAVLRDDDTHYFDSYEHNGRSLSNTTPGSHQVDAYVDQISTRSCFVIQPELSLMPVSSCQTRKSSKTLQSWTSDVELVSCRVSQHRLFGDTSTGTDLLVFAARAGAKHVYAIEASGLASKARENIAKNGFKDKIT
jgi:protein arginine N-methyltransferase 3